MQSSFIVYTLVDITDTACTDPRGMSKEYRQNQNLNTLLQVLGMRGQVLVDSVDILPNQNLSDYKFGKIHTGSNTVWKCTLLTDTPDAWDKKEYMMYYAHSDLHLVPIYTSLSETIIMQNVFDTSTASRNIYFKNN